MAFHPKILFKLPFSLVVVSMSSKCSPQTHILFGMLTKRAFLSKKRTRGHAWFSTLSGSATGATRSLFVFASCKKRDHGATLRLIGGRRGAVHLSLDIGKGWWKTLFFLTLYDFKNIGGYVSPSPPLLRGF